VKSSDTVSGPLFSGPRLKSTNIHAKRVLACARGDEPCDVVIKDVTWLDVFNGRWQRSDVALVDQIIVGTLSEYEGLETINGSGLYLVPGFIDSHVHIESSMMTPQTFERMALARGTTSVIWDPHEIANVAGNEGIRWCIAETEHCKLDFFMMMPSCVPSTPPSMGLETSGAQLSADDMRALLSEHPGRFLGLAEMMNWPGVVYGDADVQSKLKIFQSAVKDGHCPQLLGKNLNAYAALGIHTCHETTTLTEAREKLAKGIHLLIREGSCAKDADALLPVVDARSACQIGFCSDDRNPLDIIEGGHIDAIVNKGLKKGIDPIDVFRSASYGPSLIYGLKDRGAIAPGYQADLVLLSTQDQSGFVSGLSVRKVIKAGKILDSNGDSSRISSPAKSFQGRTKNINLGSKVETLLKTGGLFNIPGPKTKEAVAKVIGVRPGQILTDLLNLPLKIDQSGLAQEDLVRDIMKIAVIERHHGTGHFGVGLVKGFNMTCGAIATSINHDCHNVIVTGSSDEAMLKAVEALREQDGGIVVVADNGKQLGLALPIAGLMTKADPQLVSESLHELKSLARDIGCTLEEPFLQLSFLALPVIPSLKITDRGLVDAQKFKVVSIWND
jgi:adenine deaminase